MPSLPYSGYTTIKQLIAERQDLLGLDEHEIAVGIGYDSAAVVSLIKAGTMRLPMNTAHALAEVLHVEPGDVLRTLLHETSPEMLDTIEACVGPLALSATEKRLILKLRETATGRATSPLVLDGSTVVALVIQD